jgi:hypothetical protein
MPETAQAKQENWQWRESLDALIAAPEHHLLLLENDRVRVLDTRITPGATVPVQTHRWPSVLYVVSMSDFVRYNADGEAVVDSRNSARPTIAPAVFWSEPLPPHSLENVGKSELRVICVELKD